LEEEMRLPGAGGGGGNGIRFGAAREPPGRPPRDFSRIQEESGLVSKEPSVRVALI
jgi:hypothetical protein